MTKPNGVEPTKTKEKLNKKIKKPKNQSPSNNVKQRTIVTPWKDTAEFNKVYNWLFGKSTTPANRRQALSHIRIWNLRRGSLCPAAVLATGVLVNAQLQDKQGSCNIQTTYASAFTRFYNFMSSIMQGYNRSTMYETAHELGLQSFIVDLRHLCAHGQELPPAEVLRNTSEHCLEWLRTYYWVPQGSEMQNLDAHEIRRTDKVKFSNDVKKLFELYDLALECHRCGAQSLKEIKKLKASSVFNKIRQYKSTKSIKTAREVLDAVVNDLSAILKRESSSMKHLLDIFIDNIFTMKYLFQMNKAKIEQEEELIEATQGLFRMLAAQGYIENVFLAFVQLTENESGEKTMRNGASYWAIKLVETFTMLNGMKRMYKEELDLNSELKEMTFSSLNTSVMSKTMRKLLIYSGFDLSRTLVFGDSANKPRTWTFERDFIMQRLISLNIYSLPIILGLLPLTEPSLDAKQIEALTSIFNVYVATEVEPMDADESEILSSCDKIKELLSDLQEIDNSNESSESKLGIWTLDKNDWSNCALGVLPWEQEE